MLPRMNLLRCGNEKVERPRTIDVDVGATDRIQSLAAFQASSAV
jgi:hypothetical protein